jgi:hypothetical protein
MAATTETRVASGSSKIQLFVQVDIFSILKCTVSGFFLTIGTVFLKFDIMEQRQ